MFKKKNIALIVGVILIGVFAIGFSACVDDKPCTHTWADGDIITAAKCETEGSVKLVCSKCGEEGDIKILPALGHDWKNNDGVCARSGCDYKCSHTGSEWENKTCETCGHFRQHYTKFKKKYGMINCGHCIFPRLKTRKPYEKACKHYKAKG